MFYKPCLPFEPPMLEYVDGVLTEDSKRLLKETIYFYRTYVDQYLTHIYQGSLVHLEDAQALDFNKLGKGFG